MSNGISELQRNAESRVDRVVQTLDTGYSDVNKKFQYDVMRTVEVRRIRTVDKNTSSSQKITVEVRRTRTLEVRRMRTVKVAAVRTVDRV